jgi:cyclohexa-1,5-dienecarbonyl-CoA hydratase
MNAPRLVEAEVLQDGRLLRLVLNQPKANILSMAMMDALRVELRRHAGDVHLKMVVLQGAGGNFCFGASVEEHRKEQAASMLSTFHGFIREVAAYPVPVAALVEGRCLGGGFELALACHLLFSSANAQYGCPEVKLGVFPPVLAAVGALRLGAALAEQLIITGNTIGGERMQQAGAVTLMVGSDAMADVTKFYQENLAGLSAHAVRQATWASRHGSGMLKALDSTLAALEQHYVAHVITSHDGNEGIQAFIERRPPVWKDA